MKWRNIKSDIFQNSLVKSQKFILQWTSIYNYELETQSKVTQNIFWFQDLSRLVCKTYLDWFPNALDRYKTWQLIQESIWVVKILIITYYWITITISLMAAGIGQRTCEIEVLITSIVTREYIYGIRGRNLPNNPKKVKMIAVFIIWIFKSIWILKWKSNSLLYKVFTLLFLQCKCWKHQ